jgi:hypothetical protein
MGKQPINKEEDNYEIISPKTFRNIHSKPMPKLPL